MILVGYIILGIFLLIKKRVPVTGKRELRPPQTYIAIGIILFFILIAYSLGFFIEKKSSYITWRTIVLIIPLIPLFLMSKPKEKPSS